MILYIRFLAAIVLIFPLIACAKTQSENCKEDANCYYQVAQKKYKENNGYNADVIAFLNKSAELGMGVAQYKLGLVYGNKNSSFYDYSKSKFWLKKQSKKNYDAAYFLAKLIYERGDLEKYDYMEIENNLKYAIQGDDADALRDLSMLYFYAPKKHQDFDKVYLYSTIAAQKNIPEAQYILGVIHDLGKGSVTQDYKKAFYWYSLAAQKKNSAALNNLGVLYARGQGVEKNESKAIEYFEESYKLGNTGAMLNLGDAYLKGMGVKQNIPLAKKYFDEALVNGDKKASDYLNRIEN